MAEFRFYHLERRRLDQALPDILEDALGHKLRAVVQAPSSERVEALNEQLWTFSDESFLPHGAARDGEAEAQPVYLTDGAENPNGAKLRVLLSGVDAAPSPRRTTSASSCCSTGATKKRRPRRAGNGAPSRRRARR